LISISYFIYQYKKHNQGKNTTDLFSPELSSMIKIQYLRSLYHKTLLGIEQVQNLLFKDIPPDEIQSLITIDSIHNTIITNLYPEDIKIEMKSHIKGRTMLLLIEIAYQGPKKSNSKYLSDMLSIPQSTVTKEVKKLLEMNYITQFVSTDILFDTRYKFYSLTEKGLIFLHLLKESLSMSILHATPRNV
jgi:DNA-binding MarR family transcriptional regulator